jgi:hypothetical protein
MTTSKTSFLVLLTLFLLISCALEAQKGPVSTGGAATGATGTLHYSIGQIDYITATGHNGTLTQGIQQPFTINVVTGIAETGITLCCSIYPNPAAEYIVLKVLDPEISGMTYALYDGQGKLLAQQKLNTAETFISLSGLPNATYLITILNSTRPLKSFHIIKNQ